MSDEILLVIILMIVVGGIIGTVYRYKQRRRTPESVIIANLQPATDQEQTVRQIEAKLRVEGQLKSGADWFFWDRWIVVAQLLDRYVWRGVEFFHRARHNPGN